MLIFSALTFNKIGEVTLAGLLVMPETLIFLIFGLFHSYLALIGRETAYNRFQLKENLNEKILAFISDTILYSTFYRLVLLPSCGFGYIEWALLLLFFAQEFGIHFHVKIKTKDDVVDEKKLILFDEEKIYSCGKEKFVNPFQLTILGLVLWGFKIIVRYFLPQNLYQSLSGNKTVMNLILVTVIFLAVYGIKRLFDLEKHEKSVTIKGKTVLKTIVKSVGGVLKSLGSVILAALSGPALIVVVLVVVVIFGLGGFFLFRGMKQDLLFFVGRILNIVLSTDNAGYTETNLNTIGQIFSIMIFFVVQITENYFFERNIQSAVETKWLETIEKTEKIPEKNLSAIQQILRKQILRNDISNATKQKSYALLTEKMSDEERNIANENLVKELLK